MKYGIDLTHKFSDSFCSVKIGENLLDVLVCSLYKSAVNEEQRLLIKETLYRVVQDCSLFCKEQEELDEMTRSKLQKYITDINDGVYEIIKKITGEENI